MRAMRRMRAREQIVERQREQGHQFIAPPVVAYLSHRSHSAKVWGPVSARRASETVSKEAGWLSTSKRFVRLTARYERGCLALPAVRRSRRAGNRVVPKLCSGTTAQRLPLRTLRVAAGCAGIAVRTLPAPRAAVGVGLGAVPLPISARPAGSALQVWRRSRRGPGAGARVVRIDRAFRVAAGDRTGAAAPRSPAFARLQPSAGTRQASVETLAHSIVARCAATRARDRGAKRTHRRAAPPQRARRVLRALR